MSSAKTVKSPLEYTSSSSGLVFINQTGPRKSKEDLTKVRKHVMKGIGKARRRGLEKGTEAPPVPLSHHIGADYGRIATCEVPRLKRDSRRILQQAVEELHNPRTMITASRNSENLDIHLEKINPTRMYPIQGHGYIPLLVNHFQERFGMSIMPVDPKSMAYRLQTVWIQRSLGTACLFHATLYAASAHLDASRREHGSRVTLFHQAEVARLVQRQLAHMTIETLDESIAAVIPLAFFSYVEGNLACSKAHLGALQKMIEVKGGLDKLGFDGLLAGLVRLSFMTFAIVFDGDLTNAPNIGLGELPNRPPTGLISRILKTDEAKESRYKLQSQTHEILQDVYIVSLHINKIEQNAAVSRIFRYWRLWQQGYMPSSIDAETRRLSSNYEDKHQRCVELAAVLFFSLVDGNINSQCLIVARHNLLQDLQAALTNTDEVMWLNSAPIAYSWVCLTGAAASEESSMRGWFYFRQGSMSRALNVDNTSLIEDAWLHFHWLRQIARSISDR